MIKDEQLTYISFSASILMHAVLILAAAFLINLSFQIPDSNAGFVQVQTNFIESIPEKKNEEKTPEEPANEPELPEEKIEKKAPPEEINSASEFLAFTPENSDTNNLNNVYKESSLNVTIKYPAGWTYIDQNVKNKLDGVTFVAIGSNYNPPPYVHLAVQDKYLFNENRYKFKLKTRNYTAYYNEPEELAGQVSQTFYIRTDDDEDFTIKFIMKGKKEFMSLQPLFFGMIRTFKFG